LLGGITAGEEIKMKHNIVRIGSHFINLDNIAYTKEIEDWPPFTTEEEAKAEGSLEHITVIIFNTAVSYEGHLQLELKGKDRKTFWYLLGDKAREVI
jgi:hypothetical protein